MHEHPFSYTKHSLIDSTCEGPYLTPPRRSPGPSTVLAGSLLLNTQWRRSQLCIYTTGTLEPCLVLAMIGAPSSSVTGRGSVDVEDTDLIIIIRKAFSGPRLGTAKALLEAGAEPRALVRRVWLEARHSSALLLQLLISRFLGVYTIERRLSGC